MNDLIKIVDKLINTDNGWAAWSRKIMTSLVLSGLFFVGFTTYQEYQEDQTNFHTLEERIEKDPGAFSDVKTLMADTQRAYESIEGIWLYSWPDAHSLDVVHSAGTAHNPIPLGHFWTTDASDVGKLSLRICTELNRKSPNTACTVWGNGDAWGLLVVVWDPDTQKPNHFKEMINALAQKIGHKLYPHYTE